MVSREFSVTTRGVHLLPTSKYERSKVLTSSASLSYLNILLHYIDGSINRELDEYYTTAIRKTCVKVIDEV